LAWRAVGEKSLKDALARSDEISWFAAPVSKESRHLGSPTEVALFSYAFKKKSPGRGPAPAL
jgi:hypothetical protein